jgi:RNA polymerase sigma-70 factor, ECF subfamily
MLITPVTLLDKLSNPHAEEAWHRFVDIYTPLLYHWAKRMNIPASDASDLLQDVFVLLYREVPQFQSNRRGHFHGWLHAVFKNKALEWLRKHQRQPANGSPVSVTSVDPQDELDETEYRKYITERVLQLMKDSFPEATWRACWLSVVEDRPAEAIAKELSITVNMVYLAKSRVLRQLRQELAGLLD